MKDYKIFLWDRITRSKSFVEDYQAEGLEQVQDRLKTLQSGYCEGKERPKITRLFHEGVRLIMAESSADFSYYILQKVF